MMKTGIIGWRGMVGSVLMERMVEMGDLTLIKPIFFSTSQQGEAAPSLGQNETILQDAFDLKQLATLDIIISCQGGGYTEKIYQPLRDSGWNGYWIDAASTLRMANDATIGLDPVNGDLIQKALKNGCKTFVGGNCTVSLMLMAINGLFKANLVEWVSAMTYQAASGAGAKQMRELVLQMDTIGNDAAPLLLNTATKILDLDRTVQCTLNCSELPQSHIGAPLAGSLLPWIDKGVDNGQTREEWKGGVETNKILGTTEKIPIDGLCVRVGAMRSHSQGLTIKLKEDRPLEEITKLIASGNKWVKVIPNNKEDTLKELTPAAVSGRLTVPVGRIRKMQIGPQFLTCFTVGDQLLWGAAEPLRRMLRIILDQ